MWGTRFTRPFSPDPWNPRPWSSCWRDRERERAGVQPTTLADAQRQGDDRWTAVQQCRAPSQVERRQEAGEQGISRPAKRWQLNGDTSGHAGEAEERIEEEEGLGTKKGRKGWVTTQPLPWPLSCDSRHDRRWSAGWDVTDNEGTGAREAEGDRARLVATLSGTQTRNPSSDLTWIRFIYPIYGSF